MNKIDELVERVAKKVEPLLWPDWYPANVSRDASLRVAKQILSDPALYVLSPDKNTCMDCHGENVVPLSSVLEK